MKIIHDKIIRLKEKLLYVWSHGLTTINLLGLLSRVGIKIAPFCLYLESGEFLSKANIRPLLDKPYEVIFLNEQNIYLFKEFENYPPKKDELYKLWENGSGCLCLRSEGAILGYGWYDLNKCNYEYLSFELKDNEAYTFKFNTAKHMRGKNIAPFLRVVLYAHLAQMRRNRFYSVTEIFNTPAIRFKEKIHATPLCYYIYVNLFNVVNKSIKIKKMENHLA